MLIQLKILTSWKNAKESGTCVRARASSRARPPSTSPGSSYLFIFEVTPVRSPEAGGGGGTAGSRGDPFRGRARTPADAKQNPKQSREQCETERVNLGVESDVFRLGGVGAPGRRCR